MTKTQQVAQVLATEARALTIVQLMGRTGLGEWSVRNALARLQLDGIVTHGDGIVTGRMGRRRVRYALTVVSRRKETAA